MMEQHRDLLEHLVQVGVTRGRRQRLMALLHTKRGRITFRNMLHHELRDQIDPGKVVGVLPDSAWDLPAVLFAAEGPGFGQKFDTLRAADAASHESSICITIDGRYAIVRPETFVDDMLLLCLA